MPRYSTALQTLIAKAAQATRCTGAASAAKLKKEFAAHGMALAAATRAVQRQRARARACCSAENAQQRPRSQPNLRQSSATALPARASAGRNEASWRASRSHFHGGSELRLYGLHLASPTRYLTKDSANLRAAHVAKFSILGTRSSDASLTTLQYKTIAPGCNARLLAELLLATAQLKTSGGFTGLRWICLQGLASAAAATHHYLQVLDALDVLLKACATKSNWVLGINFGELDFSELVRQRVRTTINTHAVPRFYFSANLRWKEKMKHALTADRRRRESEARTLGAIPWWVDVRNAAWLAPAAEPSREPPDGHGCEQGFRRGLPSEKLPMGQYFWEAC